MQPPLTPTPSEILEKPLLGGSEIFNLVWGGGGRGGVIVLGGSHNFEVKTKTAQYQHEEYFWNN